MDLNHVSVFVRVVEAESFTAAAAGLGLPKSSVSRSVSRLEEELGVRLLQRTTRKLALTDAGRAYFQRAREAMAGLDDATAAVKDMSHVASGVVRLTAPLDLGVLLLPDIVVAFVKKHPDIHVDLSLTGRTLDLVEEGFDLAVRAGPLVESTLVARRVGTGALGLFASPAYLKRRGRPKAIADLAKHDCVLFRARGGKATWKITGPEGETSVDVMGQVNSDELSFVHRAIAAGLGIGTLPLFISAQCDAGQRAEIVRVLPDCSFHGGSLHVVSPPVRYEPARVKLFRDFLVKSLLEVHWEP